MNQVNTMEGPLGRGKRIALIIVGALIVFFITGPPDFAAGMLLTAWNSDLDGGAHQLHLLMRGVSAAVTLFAGLMLIIKPAWALGALQKFVASAIAFPIAGIVGMHFWPPIIVYPLIALIAGGVILWVYRGRFPWQQPQETRPAASRPLLALTAIIAIPLIVYGLNQASLQRTSEVLHGDLGHWAGGLATALMIIIMMFLAALRWPGWRVPAWGGAFTLLMLGMASNHWPNQASSIGEGWGSMAVIAAIAFVGVAELEGRLFARTVPQPAQPAGS